MRLFVWCWVGLPGRCGVCGSSLSASRLFLSMAPLLSWEASFMPPVRLVARQLELSHPYQAERFPVHQKCSCSITFILLELMCSGTLERPDLPHPSRISSDPVVSMTPCPAVSLISSVTLGESFFSSDPQFMI